MLGLGQKMLMCKVVTPRHNIESTQLTQDQSAFSQLKPSHVRLVPVSGLDEEKHPLIYNSVFK